MMTYEQMEIQELVRKEMNHMIPYRELEYSNGVVATIIANGHSNRLTEDWVRRRLLTDVEDRFITYEQAIAIKDNYKKAVDKVKEIFA